MNEGQVFGPNVQDSDSWVWLEPALMTVAPGDSGTKHLGPTFEQILTSPNED